MRLGVGHPGHKDRVAGYVLNDFSKADRDWLEPVLQGVSDGAPALAAGDASGFSNAVGLRVAPPRSGGGKAEQSPPAERPANADDPAPEQAKSTLQRLVDRFR